MARSALSDTYGEFTVPTLEYLRRGGRITRVQEVVGNLLGVRPVIAFQSGKLEVLRRMRQGQTLNSMIAALERRFESDPVDVAVGLAGRDPVRLAELRAAVDASQLNVREKRFQPIGCVIGAHTRPGMMAVTATRCRPLPKQSAGSETP
ncbi:DegV family protein [Deinococcus lacus]|uniref:DegV family protein n=1 Tax=Deinococcus lacus TaxID=392561 RepID=A0ABW1YBW8_9DEIO